jgi:RNA polymerase sigma-70 factor (ECF subfamily)
VAHNDGAARDRLAELYRAHSAELTRFAVRRVGAEAAPDVVSETFLVAWRRLDQVPADGARAWLYSVAGRVIGHEYRGARRRAGLHERLAGEPRRDWVGDHAETVSVRQQVAAVLAAMTAQDQEALRLAEWEQLSPAEAAAVLGCSVTAYKVRLHRARRRFAELIRTASAADERNERVPLAVLADGGKATR